MRLADIESLTDTPPDRLVHLPVDLWAHTVLLVQRFHETDLL